VNPPDPRDERIAKLEADVAALKQLVAVLLAENAELKRRLGMNSTNSNKPPSSDGPDVQRPGQKPKGKKRGGQSGHDPNLRQLIEPGACRQVIPHIPQQCRCGSMHLGTPELEARHQVISLPELKAPVDEHQSFSRTCLDCGALNTRPIPPEILCSAFGSDVVALIGQLTGEYHLPKRAVQRILADLFGIDISLGAISDQEHTVARALEKPVQELRQAVQKAEVANGDETSWREEKKKAWLWVVVTQVAIVFRVIQSRGKAVAQEVLGDEFGGIFGSDRWASYEWVNRRQICWAHLIRDYLGWVARGGIGETLGMALLAQVKLMFEEWNRLKEKEQTRDEFKQRMTPIREEVGRLLRQAKSCADDKVAGMAKNMLEVEHGLWSFVDHEGIEPTNNAAERALRHAVIWRKLCFGTDSKRGSQFVERVLSAVATLKLKNQDVREYLTRAVEALRRGGVAPSLLPATP
jgi:transposase